MSDAEKLVSHYRLKTLLRRDGFGAVYLTEDTRGQQELLLRVIELDQPTLTAITGRVRARSQRDHPLVEQIRQRMKHISELKHSHILAVNEFGEEHSQNNNAIIFYMASPLEKESLLSYWSEHTSSAELIALDVVADLLVQAGEALHAVHRRGLVHQYVRLSSFMLRSSTRGRRRLHLLLTDFWFADISAAILEEGQMGQSLSVYLAPEQLNDGKAVAASDQYALALLAYELLLGHRLSRVDLSLHLYENFVRQSSTEISESDLARARTIDLVLVRALAENPSARFSNIEEFALTFRAAVRGEAVDLAADETVKLPLAGAAGIAGSLAVGALLESQQTTVTPNDNAAEMLAAAQIDAETHPEHGHSLHKTILTSEGMEVEEITRVTEAETTSDSGALAAAGAVGFVAGLAAGEAIGAASGGDIAAEQTMVMASGASDIAAEQTTVIASGVTQTGDIAAEQTAVMSSGAAVQTANIAEADTLVMEGGAAALATGVLLAGASEAGEITQPAPLATGGSGNSAQQVAAASGSSALKGQQTSIAGGSGTQRAADVAALAGATLAAGAVQQASAGAAGAGVVTPARGTAGKGRRGLALALSVAAAVILVGGIVAYAAFAFFVPSFSSAKVTVTLQSHNIQASFLVKATIGSTATSTQSQVQARMLSSSSAQSKGGQASGSFQGVQASGFITFHNISTGCGCPIIVPAGTVFTSSNGVRVATDTIASVASQCTVTVRAHAVNVGPGGNIGVGSVNTTFGSMITATNPFAFGGGQVGRNNNLVQQSDIDSLSSALQTQVTQSARTALTSQLESNEHLFANPTCQTQTSSDRPAGAVATSFTVTVTATCTAEAYDYASAVQIVQQQAQSQATSFGSTFALDGDLQTQVKSASLVDASAGTILLEIDVQGTWLYQYSQSQQRAWAQAIAGRDVNQARAILTSYQGVEAASFTVSGLSQSTLPSDASKITIVVKS